MCKTFTASVALAFLFENSSSIYGREITREVLAANIEKGLMVGYNPIANSECSMRIHRYNVSKPAYYVELNYDQEKVPRTIDTFPDSVLHKPFQKDELKSNTFRPQWCATYGKGYCITHVIYFDQSFAIEKFEKYYIHKLIQACELR